MKLLLSLILTMTLHGSSAHKAPQPVWVFGDSISAGQGLPASQGWIAQLASRANLSITNFSRPGYAFSGYLGNISDELTTAYKTGSPTPTVIVAAGSNDLSIHDGTSILATELAALAVRDSLLAHGAKTVLFAAVIPRGDGYESLRQQLNLWMALNLNYEQVDYFLNPPFKSQYYQNESPQLHPNYDGAHLMAYTFDLTKLS